MYATIEAPNRRLTARPASHAYAGSDRREHMLLSKRELAMLSLVLIIVVAVTLIQPAGNERVLRVIPVESVLEQAPRVAELAPSPPNIKLTSPVPPSSLCGGGRSRAMAM